MHSGRLSGQTVQGGVLKQPLTFRDRAKCLGLAQLLLPELRQTARFYGYALTEHGSRQRDIDLVAIPWVEDCSSPEVLAEAIRKRTEELIGVAFQEKRDHPSVKPHSRTAWLFHLGGGPALDLSVVRPTGRYGWDDATDRLSYELCFNEYLNKGN